MSPEPIISATASWLWEQYGKALTDKALGEIQKKWRKFHWRDAEVKYRARLRDQHGTTMLLGNPKKITIENIYTDVYVLDKLTAFRRFDLEKLKIKSAKSQANKRKTLQLDNDEEDHGNKRKSALRIVTSKKRLFILGKPGSGKTTLLKFLTLQACVGKIPRTPVFVSLREWADSKLELLPFLVQQFEICAFPDAKEFITQLLEKGDALVLFDGLDEVNQEGDQRTQMIRNLTNFAKRYSEAQICVTCRIAATDYSFDQFTYLEIANFDDRQVRQFVRKWHQDDRAKLKRFLIEFEKPEHEGLRELAQTPLLLALLCLAFDETLTFPIRRVDLYREALDALLKKWDASRGIRRDEIYRNLSPLRKEQMLARIATQNFEAGVYFMQQEMLVGQITLYLQTLPVADLADVPDGDVVLKAIESQHGILIERAHGIYSFSHLTFQEYFTARYIVENAASGTLTHLIKRRLTDDRWHEVFLLTASLLDNADAFFEKFLASVTRLIQDDKRCSALLRWVKKKAALSNRPKSAARALLLIVLLDRAADFELDDDSEPDLAFNSVDDDEDYYFNIIDLARSLARDLAVKLDHDRDIHIDIVKDLNLGSDIELARDLLHDFGVELEESDLEHNWRLSESQCEDLIQYLEANLLLVECLDLAVVSDRVGIEKRLLLPIGAPQ